MRDIDDDGRKELVPCRVEEREPDVHWSESYRILRLKGISPSQKSLLFCLIHELLPSKERVSHIMPANSPACNLCNDKSPETYLHCFFSCSHNREAGEALLRCATSYARTLTAPALLRLEVEAEDPFLLPTIVLIATGLQLIWNNRHEKKITTLWSMRSELEARISLLRRTRKKQLREAANILDNMVSNFFF